jgi:6-phosphofructokinase 1
MIIIPEMFYKTKVTFEAITKLLVSSMVKRKILGIEYGAAIVSEGVFHFMTDDEVISTGINFTYDDHGHPELGNVSKAHIFNMLVQQKLKKLNISIKSRPNELGYELRCVRPIAFDLAYATMLGTGVYKLYKEGKTGCMVTQTPKGDILPLYLKYVEDANGKIKPRLVNMDSERVKLVYENNLHYITPADYEAAKKYLPDPAEYDFKKILGW